MTSDNSITPEDERRIESVVSSLKELFTIVMAIAVTNTMFQFFELGGRPRFMQDFSLFESLVFILLIVMMIRFYHGNTRHLDEVFIHPICDPSKQTTLKWHKRVKLLAVDYAAIFLESLIFCVLSFYLMTYDYLFGLLTLLLIVDLIWFTLVFFSAIFSAISAVDLNELKKSLKQLGHQKNWLLTDIITIVIVLIVYVSTEQVSDIIADWVFLSVFFANIIVDFALNWNFLFPSFSKRSSTGDSK